MTPRTRAKDKDSSERVYKSKNVPQQVHFPGRRKTIRRPIATTNDGGETRQPTISRGKLKRTTTVADSDEETDLESAGDAGPEDEKIILKEEEGRASSSKPAKTWRKKRASDAIQAPRESEDEAEHASKRRRRSAAQTPQSRIQKVKAEPEDDGLPQASAKSIERKRDSAKRRRQSTMTQMVEGRTPLSDAEEPMFKTLKRSARRSMSRAGKTSQDKKQQTLTQMVPGLTSFEMMSDEDFKDADSHDDAVLPAVAHDVHSIPPLEASFEGAANIARSVDYSAESDTEAEYHPTQYIDAPITRTRRMRARVTGKKRDNKDEKKAEKGRKAGWLATPNKQRNRIIQSSQSPADSPLKTPVSDRKRQRSPLSDISGNVPQPVETQSKQKQVAFEESVKRRTVPPTLRKFESTIQDSEEEDTELLGWDESGFSSQTRVVHTGQDVGAETQAMLFRIDRACASAESELDSSEQEYDELSNHPGTVRHGDYVAPPELGEVAGSNPRYIKEEPTIDETSLDGVPKPQSPTPQHSQRTRSGTIKRESGQTQASTRLASTPPPFPAIEPVPRSSPILIKDDPSEDEPQAATSPLQTSQEWKRQEQTMYMQHSEDLDGHSVQVPRSPSADHETQHSHSSKAEQQLQQEWCTYSQYVNVPENYSSSMNVAPDGFSYHATPRPPHQSLAPQTFSHQHSQATTVDEVTPKKNRTYRIPSATTTPRRIASSQLFVSPLKPPPLFIPSSFPSPAKARMEEWSSPVVESVQNTFGKGYGGSIDDFSIPLPPPPPIEDV